MPIYKGSQKIKEIYLGTTKIGKVYRGSTLVYQSSPYKAGQVLFESATPGTYTLNLAVDGKYKIWIVGGGSGAFVREVSSTVRKSGGASGAAFVGTVNLAKSSYKLTVGTGGAGVVGGSSSSNGGDSSIANLIIAGGGKGASIGNGGTGGVLTINTNVISSEIKANGNTGGYGSGTDGRSGGGSLYGGYGAGGSSPGGTKTANSGTGGYIKVQFVSL